MRGDRPRVGVAGLTFGEGLRCAAQNVLRLELASADTQGQAGSTASLSSAGGLGAGAVVRYPWWYRDPLLSPCGNGFNLSNGLEVQWVP